MEKIGGAYYEKYSRESRHSFIVTKKFLTVELTKQEERLKGDRCWHRCCLQRATREYATGRAFGTALSVTRNGIYWL